MRGSGCEQHLQAVLHAGERQPDEIAGEHEQAGNSELLGVARRVRIAERQVLGKVAEQDRRGDAAREVYRQGNVFMKPGAGAGHQQEWPDHARRRRGDLAEVDAVVAERDALGESEMDVGIVECVDGVAAGGEQTRQQRGAADEQKDGRGEKLGRDCRDQAGTCRYRGGDIGRGYVLHASSPPDRPAMGQSSERTRPWRSMAGELLMRR